MKRLSLQSTTLVVTIVGLIVAVIVGWSAIKEFTSDCYGFLSNWLTSSTTIPLWYFVVLLFVLLLVSVLCFLLLRKKLPSNKFPLFHYGRDCFEKYSPIVFEWTNAPGAIDNIVPLCPIDLTRLIQAHGQLPDDIDEILGGFASHSGQTLSCPTCHRPYKRLPDERAYQAMIEYIESQIEAYQRDDKWKGARRRIRDANREKFPGGATRLKLGWVLRIPQAGDVAHGDVQSPAALRPTTATYKVARNDTLRRIAQRVYGDESRWRTIWQANLEDLPNANRLTIGQVLVLP